jgi:hypothetical protein
MKQALNRHPHYSNDRALDAYANALATLPASGGGGCHAALLSVANHGHRAELTAEQVFGDLRQHVHGKRRVSDREIRDAIQKAYETALPSWPSASRPRPRIDGASVRQRIIQQGAGATFADLWEQSPIRMDWERHADARRFIEHLYAGDEYLFLGDDDTPGMINSSIRRASEWIDILKTEPSPPFPKLIANPLTGQAAMTKDGKQSLRCDAAVSSHRYMVCEFDGLNIEQQIAFWYACPKLPVAAITHSGKKSLHALIRVDCLDSTEWEAEVEGKLFPEVLIPLGLDSACKNQSRLTRLPGHVRADTGQHQTLLYLAPTGRAVAL